MSRASVLAVDKKPMRGSALPLARLERLFAEHHSLVWRTLRRLGLSPADAAEATRRVFRDAASRTGGALRRKERTRLLRLVLRHAFSVERFEVSEVRTRPPMIQQPVIQQPTIQQAAIQQSISRQSRLGQSAPRRDPARSGVFRRARPPANAACVDLMDRVLSHMPRPDATAFILFELEGLPLGDVAEVMSVPIETVTQVLLHARSEFKSIVAALRATPRR
jgi:DNA-directed RNA polymerase specialized sigma24 family protein